MKSIQDQWIPLHDYGPKTIRKFIRDKQIKGNVTQMVSGWVKLWGFKSNVTLKTIELVKQNDNV